MRRKVITIPAVLVTIIILVLTACGGQKISDMPGGTGADRTADTSTYWTDIPWTYNKGMGDTPMYPLYLKEENRELGVKPDGNYDEHSVDYCAQGNTVYCLEGFYGQTGDRCYYISRYDGTDEGVMHWPIELPSPADYGAEDFTVASFDVKTRQELVLFLQGWQEGMSRSVCYLALHMTPEGEILEVTDLLPAMRELGLDMDGAVSFEEAYVDGEGYYYLILRGADLQQGSDVSVLDPEGKLLGSMTPGKEFTRAEWAMKLPDGRVVFSWSGREQEYILLGIRDGEKNAVQALAREKLRDSWLWTPAQDGGLYYVSGDEKLMRWDIRTGTVQDCMYFQQLGLEGDRYSARLIIGEGGEPEILGRKDGEPVICRLSRESSDTEGLRLMSLTSFCDTMADCVTSFSMEHPDCPIKLEYFEDPYDERASDAFRNRVMAELVSGKGADLYYVRLSDMRMLYEKGALADLSQLIAEDTLSALWPGVRQMGTMDGKLVGVLPEDGASAMIVSEELWPGDHWTLEEALDVMEAHPELEYPVMSYNRLDSENVFSCLVMQNLADSPFLDMEEGRCDFANPLFIRALELAGTYSESAFYYDELQELYPKKNWVAMQIPLNLIYDYDQYKSALGEEYHVVGYPTDGESGSYWDGYMFLVVNERLLQETGHGEQIAAFLEYILSYDTQYNIRNFVRRDILENKVQEFEVAVGSGAETEIVTGYIVEDKGLEGISYRELSPGPQGDYRIEEYRQVMEKCVGRSIDTSAIEDIIWEEVGSCFSGDKDAAAVAELIQNRVQLYLEEQR